jgi:predicted metalloprotease with PDZ domain
MAGSRWLLAQCLVAPYAMQLPSPTKRFAIAFGLAAALAGLAPALHAQKKTSPVIALVVDESQAPRRIAFAHEVIQVRPGTVELAYPKWIPGEHGPDGPIYDMAALQIHAGNETLAWKRDPGDIFKFETQVPAGISRIAVDFDVLLQNTIDAHQLLLAWNTAILYPLGIDKLRLFVQPSVILPPGWKQGSSLQVAHASENRIDFAPLSIERLIDSPVLAGEYFRAVQLHSFWPAELDVTGDTQQAVDDADKAHAFELLSKLIDQDRAMFGYRHWRKMHLLVSQSDSDPYDGLEHEDSPWNAVGDAGLSKKNVLQMLGWPLLAHEQSHSWCGKYRRPAELYSKPEFQGPERTTLLWVYEGLNEYIGMMLATRAGFNDAAYMRDYLARTTAEMIEEPGRKYTPLDDTASEDWVLRAPDSGWSSIRRGQDYYDEGAVMWLLADVLIRRQSHGRKSLDDFLRSFLGQRDTGPIVVPYTRQDVETALSAVWPYDWHSFFQKRIYEVNDKPPSEGLEAAGWRIVYNSTPNAARFDSAINPIEYYGSFSIGMNVDKDASIFDVWQGSPAYAAGLGPHMKILAVNGRAYSADVLNEAIAHPQDGKIVIVARNFNTVQSYEIHYAGGVRYPHLERIPGTHDYLSDIFAPKK